MKSIAISVLMLVTSIASAQNDGRSSLEQRLNSIERRVRALEREIDVRPPMGRDPVVGTACQLTATHSGKTYLGKGPNKLDAEFEARKACQTSDPYRGNTDACNKAVVCDDLLERSVQTCLITGTHSGKDYKGTGASTIEASHNARQSCQTSDPYRGNTDACNRDPRCT